MTSTATISLPDLYGNSHWLRFLYQRLGTAVTIPGACALWALTQAGFFAALSALQGTLLPGGHAGEMSLVEDTTTLSYLFLLPFIFLLLYYSLRLFASYLNRLDEELEPSCPAGTHAALLAIARRSFSRDGMMRVRLLFVACGLLIFLISVVTNLFPERNYGSPMKWDGIAFPATYVVSRLFVLFVWAWALPIWLAEVAMQFLTMARVHGAMATGGWLKASPHAADRFGGLRRLSVSASWAGYLVLAAGVFFLAPLVRALLWGLPLHAGNYVGLALYVHFAAIGTFAPLYLVHSVLARKRADMLRFLVEAFDRINLQVAALVKTGDVEGLGDERLGRALETVDRLHQQWSALPVWPMSVSFVVRLVALIVPPALYGIQDLLKNFNL